MVINSVKNFSIEKKLSSLPGRTIKEDIYVPSIPKNILRGIVPVASVWGTDPTNLANCTDGDMSTVTGTGSKVMGASGDYGILVFDLGTIKTVLVGMKLGVWSTANGVTVRLAFSDDNITYDDGANVTWGTLTGTNTSAAELKATVTAKIGTGRYIKVVFTVTGAATANAKIYEVMAYELGL